MLWPPAVVLALAALVLFYLIDAPFLGYLARLNAGWIVAAPILLLVRAAALGLGLAAGLVFAPRARALGLAGLSPTQRLLKRAIDLLGAGLGLIIGSPLLALSALAIKLQDGGAVIFEQTRIGEAGQPFQMLKLRTMVPDAEAKLADVLARNQLRGPVFKIADDPRTTRVGRILRRWSLDELPQLWNVLKGEMSLVGPRPEEILGGGALHRRAAPTAGLQAGSSPGRCRSTGGGTWTWTSAWRSSWTIFTTSRYGEMWLF